MHITGFPGSYTDAMDDRSSTVTLDLKPARSPMDGRTEVIEGTSSGEIHVAVPHLLVFRGKVLGEPHSSVMLTVFGGRMLCSILRESGERYVLGPAKNESDATLHIFSKETDLVANEAFVPFNCISDDIDQPALNTSKKSERLLMSPPPASTLLQTDIAVEADSVFFAAAGGKMDLVLGYIASLFAMSSAIFEDEANITWHLTWVKVWTNGDPYQVKGNAYVMDAVVRPYWRAHYTNVPRDLAHIMTSNPSGGGGFGWYSLCQDTLSYSYSSPQTGHKYPTFAFTYDAYIIAHEIGHNFSLRHTHDCWWAPPLDTCYTKDDTITTRKGGAKLLLGDACCGLPIHPLPSPGSIMSYCANANYILSGQDFSQYKLEMTFTPRGGDSLRKFALEAPCITPPANPIVILTNPRGSATYPGDTTITLHWAYANLQNVSLEYSSDGGVGWNPIVANVPANTGKLDWKVANVSSQKMLVRVFDAQSDTVADTSLLFFTVIKSAAVAETTMANGTSFLLRPDPAGDEIALIPSNEISWLQCEIVDALGGVTLKFAGRAAQSSGLAMNIRSLAAGTYFLRITSPVNRVFAFYHLQ